LISLLDDRDPLSELCRLYRRALAARSAANDYEIILFRHDSLLQIG
jgi:hypothetical protein